MSPSPSSADWGRLGELLTRRRVELDPRYQNRTLFCEERDVDYRLAYDIEEARRSNFRPATLLAVAAAYAVTPESVTAALQGGSLEPLPDRDRRLRPVTPAPSRSPSPVPAWSPPRPPPPFPPPPPGADRAALAAWNEDYLAALMSWYADVRVVQAIGEQTGKAAADRVTEIKEWLGIQWAYGRQHERNGTAG